VRPETWPCLAYSPPPRSASGFHSRSRSFRMHRADLSLFHVVPDVVLALVGMQRHLRPAQHKLAPPCAGAVAPAADSAL
jgi:hypothetical protein